MLRRNSILRAAEAGLQYLAFPAISCGVYGYPYDEGARAALTTCKEHADQVKEVRPRPVLLPAANLVFRCLSKVPCQSNSIRAADKLSRSLVEEVELTRKQATKNGGSDSTVAGMRNS